MSRPANTERRMVGFELHPRPAQCEDIVPTSASVCILLSTYNGARYLPLQLQSIERQVHTDWRLIASDDGSSDETWAILSEFQARCGASGVILKRGLGKGFAENFLSLVCDPDAESDYFAFCDQDDVWHPEKLARAIAWHERNVSDSPTVYCSRTRLIDGQGRPLGYSRLCRLRPSFRNALVQNIAGGNTMIFNRAARDLLRQSVMSVPFHDWWLYLATTAVGGKIYYDRFPSTDYRVHRDNVIGPDPARMARLRRLFRGGFRGALDRNIVALESLRSNMTPGNQRTMASFRQSRNGRSAFARLIGTVQSGVYRQNLLGNAGMIIAALAKRM